MCNIPPNYVEHFCWIIIHKFCYCLYFVWLYSAPTHLRLNGAKTGKIILANLGCYKLEVKTTSSAEAKRSIDTNNSNPFSCLSFWSLNFLRQPLSHKGERFCYRQMFSSHVMILCSWPMPAIQQ
jgi:hypothetical protein